MTRRPNRSIVVIPVLRCHSGFHVRSRCAAARLFLVSAALAGGAVARAQPPAAPLRVEYRAEAGCPTEADFRARVGARLRRQVGEGDAASAYVVTIERRERRFIGRLGVRAAGGAVSDRDVAGDTCDDVVAALAVVTALAIDAQAGDAPAAVAAPMPSASASAAAAPTPPASAPLAGTPRESAPRADSAWARPPAPAADVAARLTLGAQLLFGAMIGPPSFGARVFAEPPFAATDGGAGPLRLGAALEASSDTPSTGGAASFLLAALAADACPIGAGLGPVRLSPCARVEGGLVAARRRGVAPVRGATRGWLAFALPVRAWLPLWGPLALDAEAGLRMPLLRDGFFAEGAEVVARPPPVEGVSALGLGLTIP
ncbi:MULTISPECIES: hypothetical protein [Sorangium]|uniref:Secreted protein n=1 Tax=Sorangium cellulosum TaxID=56 RepID=A0A4P2R517_SORCE|nr:MULTISPECIES: hypothetical protein [Sorangium]AUX38165.1 hypothetical protein SOCE836_104050 [Sorangium cellulosum]WCQ97453.1 hypothetical protein NQZ70_10247 [Sorangium sp. Soce836]